MALYTNDLLDKIELKSVVSYLIDSMQFSPKRWHYRNSNGDDLAFAFYHRKKRITIIVPTKQSIDWRIRIAEAIDDIAKLEDRSSFYVIYDILYPKTQDHPRQEP